MQNYDNILNKIFFIRIASKFKNIQFYNGVLFELIFTKQIYLQTEQTKFIPNPLTTEVEARLKYKYGVRLKNYYLRKVDSVCL